ncbi:MAG: toll/interleukin-1 receptor domain-containing protein [candidate division Zixibacteria bacterium]
MEEYSFPYSVEEVVNTLIEVFERQKTGDVANLLRSAHASIEYSNYDNWDGGTHYYSLILEIQIALFSEIEPKIPEIKKTIEKKIETIFRSKSNQYITEVLIAPQLVQNSTSITTPLTDKESNRLWIPGYLRLFLSHVATHKENVGALKDELQFYGISSFVAHEDIEPNAIWQNEIQKALISMNAMAALLTEEFHESKWTDQEIGFALGRRILVIPVRLGLNPYGFIGNHQGLAGNLLKPSILASNLVDVLLKQVSTTSIMQESLVVGLEESHSFAASKAVSKKMTGIGDFTNEQLNRMEAACNNNNQVEKAFGVPDRINGIIRKYKPNEDFEDDDLPF